MASLREPPRDCPLCPRLHEFRNANRRAYPDFFNDPVPSFGPLGARLLIVGLAPGLKGANRTGRPFTGDHAGALLYDTLRRHGLARGRYLQHANDGFELVSCRVTNAVRCVPPGNRPSMPEILTCRRFLHAEIGAMRNLAAILTLGRLAHKSVLSALGLRERDYAFRHGAQYAHESLALFASYHCSRYNTNTGVLTAAMFDRIIKRTKKAAGL